MAAPRADNEDGSIAVGRVEGDRILVVGGKSRCRFCEMRGVCDVPPDSMT